MGIIKRNNERKCAAFSPTPVWGHDDCTPNTCKRCFARCANTLRETESYICASCIVQYAQHASVDVRRLFVEGAIEHQLVMPYELKMFLDDADASIALLVRDYILRDQGTVLSEG
jgi:hypothetical protein